MMVAMVVVGVIVAMVVVVVVVTVAMMRRATGCVEAPCGVRFGDAEHLAKRQQVIQTGEGLEG
jgi:hypothetical protein